MNPIGSLITYLKEVWVEMKPVNWPTREQTIRLTIMVVIMSAVVAVLLGGLDFVFRQLLDTFVF